MGKSLTIAIVIEAVVLVVAFAITAMFLLFGFGRANPVLNVLLVVLWVVVAGLLLFVFWWRSRSWSAACSCGLPSKPKTETPL